MAPTMKGAPRSYPLALVVTATLLLGGCSSSRGGHAATPPPLPSSGSGAASGTASPGPVGVATPGTPTVIARKLAVPWAVAFLPDGDALVTERDTARLLRVGRSGGVTEVGKVPGVSPFGEGGLLGVAVSPSFAQDRLVFLYFSAPTENRIVRFRYDGRHLGRLKPLVTAIPRSDHHNGGRLAFGPDRMLYASAGEIGEGRLAQDRRSPAGKILRMTPDGAPAPGNPFPGSLIWSYGHRNVEGMAWDPAGRMYATEFGQDRFDEVNRIEPGRNYGWPAVEGAGGEGRYVDPLLTWSTDEASPSGLAMANGSLWAAALRGTRLWQVPLGTGGRAGRPIPRFEGRYGRLRAVVRAPDGSLWVTTSNRDGRGDPRGDDDRILRIPLR